MKKKKNQRNYLSFTQRLTAKVMVFVMLLQILSPAVVAAAQMTSDQAIYQALTNTFFQKNTVNNSFLYSKADFSAASDLQHQNIKTFHARLLAAKISLPAPTYIPIAGDITVMIPYHPTGKLVGDEYVQNRLIRQQIFNQVGRHMIDPEAYASEIAQINTLYNNAFVYAQTTGKKYGEKLTADEANKLTADMLWPEQRLVDNEIVVVPVLHLTATTIAKQSINDHKFELLGSVNNVGTLNLNAQALMLGRNTFLSVAGKLNAANGASIKSTGNLAIKVERDLSLAGSRITSDSSLNLYVGGIFSVVSGQVSAQNNLDIYAGQVNLKTPVHLFSDRYGNGTRIGEITSVTADGNIRVRSGGDIQLEGSVVRSTNGAVTLNAVNNINILPVVTQYASQSRAGDWEVSSNSLNVIGSKISAQDTIKLIAGGVINITASELISTQGGIELLAQQGIHILDELNQTQIQKVDRKGKTKGQSSEFRTEAVRAILKAGKGVLLDSEFGDVVLKATEITSAEGAQVNARNGKVHLLMTKELEEFHLQTVRKGTWTIKTRTEDVIHENNIQNAIVGGLQVQAKYGVNIEYTGKEGATLKEQLEEYAKMPEMAWMAKLYNKCWVEKEGDGITAGSISATDPNNFTNCDGPKVNWSQVEEVHDEIRKSKSTLSPAAMAIIAIAVCIAMGPAGANLIGAGGIGGATVTSTTIAGVTTVTTSISLGGAIAQAGMLTLATQAAQSLASGNNLRETISTFDSDENLRSLAISMATAGAMNYANVGEFDLFKVPSGTEYSFASFGNQAYTALAGATINSAISVSINGGNSEAYKEAFKQALVTNAINTIGQKLANKIATAPSLDGAMQYISNAALGCLTEGLTVKLSEQDSKDACASGAGAAVIAVGLADLLEQKTKGLIETTLSDGRVSQSTAELSATLSFLSAHRVDISKLFAGLVAFAAHGDVNAASNSAGVIGAAQEQRIMRTVAVSQTILAMGMADCGEASLGDCAKQAAVNEFRKGLVELGKYSAQEIDAKINYLKTQTTFFDDLGAYNAALLETNGSLEELTQASKSYPDPNSSPSDGSVHVGEGGVKVLPKVVVTAERWSVMRESLFDLGETIGLATNAADTLVQDGVKALLETPYGAPLRWGFAKVAEAAKEYPEVAALLNKPEELKEALGTGTTARLLEDEYAEIKSYINSNPTDDEIEWHKSVSNAASGFSWVVGVLGAGALGYVAKAMTFTRVTSDGRNFSNDEKDFYENEIAKEFTGITRNHLRNQLLTHNIKLKAGWDADRLYDEVLSKPKGQRPPPSDYLPAEYIAAKLAEFDSGVVRIGSRTQIVNGKFDDKYENFSMPFSEWERIKNETGGNPVELAKKLGLSKPIDLNQTVIMKFDRRDVNLSAATGNEIPFDPTRGANMFWIPGMKTSGGTTEALFKVSGPTIFTELMP